MKKLLFLSIIALLTLNSCRRDSGKSGYYPFQSEEDGRWGMMSASGKVLFSDEFDEKPIKTYCDRFRIYNQDNLWEIYTAEEKPRQIGGEYLYVGRYCNGVAAVTERGKYITLIDTEGEVVKTLDKIEGKTIAKITDFDDNGLAVIITDDDLQGVINTNGDDVVKPIYGMITVGYEFIITVDKEENDKEGGPKKFNVLDLKGNPISTVDMQKKDIESVSPSRGYIIAKTSDGYGILDTKGEWVVKPNKKYGEIHRVRNGYFIYEKGNFGLRDLNGDVILRNKYATLFFTEDKNRLIASRDGEYTLINMEGDQMGEDDYEELWCLDENHFAGKLNSHNWVIIDSNGKETSDPNVDIADINENKIYNYGYIVSDYVNISGLVAATGITKDGIDGLTFSSTVNDVIKQKETAEDNERDLSYFRGDTYVSYNNNFGVKGADIKVVARFDDKIVKAVKERKARRDSFTGVRWYEDEVVGYECTKAKPVSYAIRFNNKEKLYSKLDEVYNQVCSQASSQGDVKNKTDDAIVVKTTDNNYITVSGHDDYILVENGDPNTFSYSLKDLGYEESQETTDSEGQKKTQTTSKKSTSSVDKKSSSTKTSSSKSSESRVGTTNGRG